LEIARILDKLKEIKGGTRYDCYELAMMLMAACTIAVTVAVILLSL